jgi:hypothetical protein
MDNIDNTLANDTETFGFHVVIDLGGCDLERIGHPSGFSDRPEPTVEKNPDLHGPGKNQRSLRSRFSK